MEDNIMMISGNIFKQMIAEAAYEGAKKALAEIEPHCKQNKDYLSAEEAIEFLDNSGVTMSVGHLKNLRCKGEIPAFIINRKLRFLRQDLELWIDRNANHDLRSMENAERVLAKSARRK